MTSEGLPPLSGSWLQRVVTFLPWPPRRDTAVFNPHSRQQTPWGEVAWHVGGVGPCCAFHFALLTDLLYTRHGL